MNGIVININPVLVHLGSIAITWYNLIIIAAIVVALAITVRESKRKGFAPDVIYNLSPLLLVAGIVGARLFHVIDRWEYYGANPAQILAFQRGGLAIWGAIIGGIAAIMVYTRVRHIPVLRLLDTLVPGLVTALIIGRLACIVNGDAYGGVTSLPWGFVYINPAARIPDYLAGIPTHPYPLYEMILNGFILLLALKLRKRLTKNGLLFTGFLSLYSVERFVLTFIRQENRIFLGLQEAQIVAIIMLVVSLALTAFLLRPIKTMGKETA